MADSAPDGLPSSATGTCADGQSTCGIAGLCLGLLAVLPVLALLNVFGQRPSTTSAHAAAGDLTVTARRGCAAD